MFDDDLTQIFTAQPDRPAQPMSYRQGVIVTWNKSTAENTVNVGGTTLTNLPLLNTSEALLLAADDVVGIMVVGSMMAILGRLTIPATAAAATALNMIKTHSANVSTRQSTSSGTFGDLTTAGPSVSGVVIGAAGRCLVTVSALIEATANSGSGTFLGGGHMGFAITGASSLSAVVARSVGMEIGYSATPNSTMALNANVNASRTVLVEGLTSGTHTFTAKYASLATSAAFFSNRNITVIPL